MITSISSGPRVHVRKQTATPRHIQKISIAGPPRCRTSARGPRPPWLLLPGLAPPSTPRMESLIPDKKSECKKKNRWMEDFLSIAQSGDVVSYSASLITPHKSWYLRFDEIGNFDSRDGYFRCDSTDCRVRKFAIKRARSR